MGRLFVGLGIWFTEVQKTGRSKSVPAIVLAVGPDKVVIARGTSQSYDYGGFSGEDGLAISALDPSGKRLCLTSVTRFRRDDVKVIDISAVCQTCSQMSRGTYKQVRDLTRDAVGRLASELDPPPDDGA
jgi:hypothetical protein